MKKNNVFRIIYIFLIMNFSNRIGQFGLLFYLWTIVRSPLIIGFVFFTEALMSVLSGYIYSILTRRYKKTSVLKFSYISRILTYSLFFVFFYYNFENYYILISIMILHATTESFLGPIIHSSVVYLVKKEQLHKVNSTLSLIDNTSLFLSPIIGSILISLSKNDFTLLFTTVILLLVSGLFLVFIWNNIIPYENDQISNQNILYSIKKIISNKKALYVLIIFIFLNFTLFPLLSIIFPALIVSVNNQGANILAIYEVAFTIGLISVSLSQLLTSKSNSERYLIISVFLCFIGYFTLGLNKYLYLNIFSVIILGGALSLIRVHNNTYFQLILSPNILSDFFAIRGVILNCLAPLSLALTSLFMEYFKIEDVIISYSFLIFIIGIFFSLLLLKFKNT